jgi:hypothetical protein
MLLEKVHKRNIKSTKKRLFFPMSTLDNAAQELYVSSIRKTNKLRRQKPLGLETAASMHTKSWTCTCPQSQLRSSHGRAWKSVMRIWQGKMESLRFAQ